MEERVTPAGDKKDHHPPPAPPLHEPPSSLHLPHDHNYLVKPLPPPPGSETYVVQIPRDQVYRVPPPENSKIVETYLQQTKTKKGHGACIWLLLTILILGLLIGALIGIINLLYNPKLPQFSITNFNVHSQNRTNKSHAKPGYVISFDVQNPNERMDVFFGGKGYGLLSYNHNKVAGGKFSSFSQQAEKSSTLKIMLNGTNTALPSGMEKSISNTKTKKEVSLGFKIFVTAKTSSWAKTTKNDIVVSCHFKVNTLAANTRVVDQECITLTQN